MGRAERRKAAGPAGARWLAHQARSREAVIQAVGGWVALLGALTTTWTQEFKGRQRDGLPVHVRITIEVAPWTPATEIQPDTVSDVYPKQEP